MLEVYYTTYFAKKKYNKNKNKNQPKKKSNVKPQNKNQTKSESAFFQRQNILWDWNNAFITSVIPGLLNFFNWKTGDSFLCLSSSTIPFLNKDDEPQIYRYHVSVKNIRKDLLFY